RGIFSENTLKWTNELGYTHIFWSLAFKDWNTGDQKGWEYAYDQIMDQIHPGAIVLLHAVSSDNAEALAEVIIELKKQGYNFKSLDDLVMKNKISDGFFGLKRMMKSKRFYAKEKTIKSFFILPFKIF